MNFGKALEILKVGKKVFRKGWNGKGTFVFMAVNTTYYDNVEKRTKSLENCLVIKTSDGKQVPWFPSQSDIFAEDWGTL